MRIIAGTLKNREFKSPHGHKTHPMSDKVRGSLFNVLGDIEGLTFLDAFTGSGALAVEAASRGAASVIAVDSMEKRFDIVLLDPPYEDLQLNLLQKLIKRHVKPAGLAVLSFPGKQDAPEFEKTKIVSTKNHGDSQLVFYRKIK
jgi:16S rRNA (guanine966-N2)-methyltransferase